MTSISSPHSLHAYYACDYTYIPISVCNSMSLLGSAAFHMHSFLILTLTLSFSSQHTSCIFFSSCSHFHLLAIPSSFSFLTFARLLIGFQLLLGGLLSNFFSFVVHLLSPSALLPSFGLLYCSVSILLSFSSSRLSDCEDTLPFVPKKFRWIRGIATSAVFVFCLRLCLF